jgi:sterol desaturase/sphingolipid hydroxylase (fatty acid hydroxylase superfamily)
MMPGGHRDVASSDEGVLAPAARTLATPVLLATSLVAWIALWTGGMPPLASSLVASLVIVAGVVLLEIAAPRPGLAPRPAGTLRSDVASTATTTLVAVVAPSLVVIPLGRTAGVALGASTVWPTNLPLWASAIAAVLLADFTSYWWHRLQHTTGGSWLWRLHSMHHSPGHFDFWMGGRVHPLDVVGFTFVGYGLLAVLGAPVTAIEITAFFASMVGAVHHTRTDTDCGWMNRFVPFADHHVVHHSILPHDGGNYGNITTLFDTLFGTYRAPTPRRCAPVGAWSLAEDYPQGDYPFQLLSPFGRFWARATRRPAPRREDRRASLGVAL